MNVQLFLDQPQAVYTNLDVIRGRLIWRVPKVTNVSFITVKLEGEAISRLESYDANSNRTVVKQETHKLLYKVIRVWPPPNINVDPKGKASFAVSPGLYEYPFEFKIPFNNMCWSTNKIASLAVQPRKHVRTTLPPSLASIGIEAGIRYFIKGTVNLPSFFKENPRAISFFNFDPIEPPRSQKQGEVYARRTHFFSENVAAPKKTRSGLFSRAPQPEPPEAPAVRVSVEIRLPNPAILTCGQPIPLRILIKPHTSRTRPLYLQSLQIELVSRTHIEAHGFLKVASGSWVVFSRSNMQYVIGSPGDAPETETELSDHLWANLPLPDTVSPSFITCNISRHYELVASVGLSYGNPQPGQDQFIVLPLRHNVQVFSGIKPPDELLRRLAEAKNSTRPEQPAPRPTTQVAAPVPVPAPAPAPAATTPVYRPQAEDQALQDVYNDPPPSYEDAMADNILPIDGPRVGYRPPISGDQGVFASANEKS